MKVEHIGIHMVGGLLLAGLLVGVAGAEYDRPASEKNRIYSDNAGFEEAVNLKKFRKGNPEWDTQELMVSGFSALHREQVQILKELAELRASVDRLEAKR